MSSRLPSPTTKRQVSALRSGRGNNLIRRLMRWARVTRPGDDTGDFPIQQVGYLGKIGDALVWFPYGMHANIPADELALALSMQGNPEARVVLPGSPKKRIKVAAGEVVFFHPDTGTKIHLMADGSIEIVAVGDVNVTTPTNSKMDSVVHTNEGDLKVVGDLDHDGTKVGFYGSTPVVQSPIFSTLNVTPDRFFNADSTTLGEIADVLGTLISDLKLTGIID